jgi:hypothetical protein
MRTLFLRTLGCAAVLCLVSGQGQVRADVVTNLSTGFDNPTGTLLPNGSTDARYVIGPGGTGGFIGVIPEVRTQPIPGTWLPDAASSGSRWLVLNSGIGLEGITVPPGTYFFDTAVTLAGFDAVTAHLTGLRYAADNELIAVIINGSTVFSQPIMFAEEFTSFHDIGDVGLGLFHDGLNTLRFEVYNLEGGLSPMGLRMEGRVEASSSAVPEPSALALIALGALGLAGYGWRRAGDRHLRRS